jgi:hypothetical protein
MLSLKKVYNKMGDDSLIEYVATVQLIALNKIKLFYWFKNAPKNTIWGHFHIEIG